MLLLYPLYLLTISKQDIVLIKFLTLIIFQKNVLCDENGFLDVTLVRLLLSGLSMTVIQAKVVGGSLFNLLFETCPALVVASMVSQTQLN